ncbi:hypothetical protein DES49_1193 [Halospina denitrificans]|uniref:G domain-containing protein n=1 Tax=Halospina denitrificans TaxID=332522 RepID=A0A4R7K1L4_9GAMM|nr:GTPase domain-containing protein [Halospina denitrificans]TDT43379.1 hypothetical protein DES49_1193 [Halospina denitrificans]
MSALLREFGYLRLLAVVVAFLPMVVLPLLGIAALWETGYLWYWLAGLALCGLVGYGLHALSRWHNRNRMEEAITGPDPNWAPGATSAWAMVDAKAASVTPEQWPLNDASGLFRLGRDTLEDVARHFHPRRQRPLLELTVPHMLLIIERASAELRQEITDHIPLSHRLTLGRMARFRQWKDTAARLENLYRLGHAAVDPTSVVFRELRRDMGNRILGYGSEQVQTWLLREYVRKVGYYAIELYSGRLLLDDAGRVEKLTDASRMQSEEDEPEAEPLRILILGRSGSGRSSLVNALLGGQRAATDAVTGITEGIQGYRWEPDSGTGALMLDTPGIETDTMDTATLRREVLRADLILWVTSAVRADRAIERETLDRIREWFRDDPRRRPPPIVGALTHVDRLRPLREWNPPYDLADLSSAKASSIQAAVTAIADELAIPTQRLVPVCLRPEAIYNDDALLTVICGEFDEARRVRFLRCLKDRHRDENWRYLWRQLGNAGRFVVEQSRRMG